MRNKIDVLVGKLRNSSMLEDGDYFDSVKLHDVMRELGIWITSLSTSNNYHSKFIPKAGVGIIKAPDASEWYKATRISLINNYRIESLPQLPNQCPQLHALLLSGISFIKDIPQVNFLDHMPALRILDLSSCFEVKNLPPSISHLVNLHSLCLSWCLNLENLPHEIGNLVQLILLDLHGCKRLRKEPVEMKKLKILRCLDISYTGMLKRIPHGVLSGLQKLEKFNTNESGLKWYPSGIEELSQLTTLTDISIEIRKVNVFQWFRPLTKSKCMRSLHLRNCAIDPSVLLDLLRFDGNVRFTSCEGLTRAPTSGCEGLIVRGCPDLKMLLIVEEAERNAFESLRRLELDQVDKLQAICTGVPQYGCFSNLKYIKIKACPNLKVLFTNGVTWLLKKLQLLYVHRCAQLVKIISDEDLEFNAFPSLEEIHLCELPELTTICHLDLNWPSLSEAHVYVCPKLRRPPFGTRRADLLLNDEMNSQMTENYLQRKTWDEER